MKTKLKYKFLLLLILLLNACSIEKFIPENERIYTGASIEMKADSTLKNKTSLKNELQNILSPKPNSKVLSTYPGLYYYYKTQKEKNSFMTRWIYKKIGEEPVYQSDINTLEIEEILVNRLENNGFFYSKASSTFVEEGKTASVKYRLNVTTPYTMKTFKIDSMPSPLYADVKSILDDSPLLEEKRFDLSNYKLERRRIDTELKDRGYYNFNSDFFIFEADTNQYDNKKFDLYLNLKDNVPQKATLPYKISKINIYPQQDLQDTLSKNTVAFNNKNYLQDSLFIKPKYLDKFITLEQGQFYNPDNSKNTARRLSSIDIYKYVNIQYKEVDSASTENSGALEANIFLSPLNKRSIRAELQAVTKSNNFTGPNLALTYTNRNLFNGGEVLDISTEFGYETQFASGENAGLNSLEYGLTTKLTFPRLISPIKIDDNLFKYSIPKTKTSLGVDFLNRTQLYTIISGRAMFGYTWNANRFITYEINPLSLNYTELTNTSEEFENILEQNPFLRQSFDQQFISGLEFAFTYNGMLKSRDIWQFYLNSTLDVAGNSLSLFAQETDSGGPEEVFGFQYAQYAKADIDARVHYKFGKNNKQTIASRIFAGYGLPYGNSDVIPYVKQYFSGGPYSVRAFRIRSLGPGTYSGNENTNSTNDFFDRTGNLRLEANIEYRFPIFSFFKGAIFTDAGNVWNTNPNPTFNGEDVFSSSFISELGVGSGVGLRVDLQGFVIRFDLAAPFLDPALPEGERLNFQLDKPILNFAIGYSF